MSISTITPLLVEATQERRALGAYNIYTMVQIDALIKIHEEFKSPLIIQVADPANGFLGNRADFMASTAMDKKVGAAMAGRKFHDAAGKTDIPVCLHLDHGKSLESVQNAIAGGFTSVMFDGSSLSFAENIEKTREAVQYAHDHDVSIEAELGVLGGVEDDVKAEHSLFTKPEEALEFVQKTGVDCLAISYGTQHGANKGKDAKLQVDIVRDVKAIFEANNIVCPIVSHGSSSVPQDIVASLASLGSTIPNAYGIDGEQMKQAIAAGIAKINVDTDIRLATALAFRTYFHEHPQQQGPLAAIQKILDEQPAQFDPRVFLAPVIGMVTDHKKPDDSMQTINALLEQGVRNICERSIPLYSGSTR